MDINQIELLNGSLLGDGSLTKVYSESRNSAFRVTHSNKQIDYLLWKSYILKENVASIKEEKRRKIIGFDKIKNCPLMESEGFNVSVNVLRTFSSQFLTEMEKKWYLRDKAGRYILNKNRRIKIVPDDLKLSPLSMTVWYMDDGTNMYSKKNKYHIRNAVLHTLCFSKKDIDILIESFRNDLSLNHIKHRETSKGFEIVILARSFYDFMDMVIENLPCESMKYKCVFDRFVPNYKSNASLNENSVKKIRSLSGKMKQVEISKMFGVSESTVHNVIHKKSWVEI